LTNHIVPKQGKLFALPQLPAGMVYRRDFLSVEEEQTLLATLQRLPLAEAKYKQFTAKRRIISYGSSYDFSRNELSPAAAIPEFLHDLRERAGRLAGVPAEHFAQALIAEYQAGTQLGWHRDVPEFEIVAGISLAGACRMRLRRYPPPKGRNIETLSFDLEPRSAYVLRDEARWGWQHSIPPTKALRYSITFRTLNGGEQ
jgi:alkylated DNA repair dioxygenase AlkB